MPLGLALWEDRLETFDAATYRFVIFGLFKQATPKFMSRIIERFLPFDVRKTAIVRPRH